MKLQQDLKLSVAKTNQLAQQFNISFRSVKRLWDQIKFSFKSGTQLNIFSGNIGKCGRKGIDRTTLKASIKTINYKDRKTLRLLQELL